VSSASAADGMKDDRDLAARQVHAYDKLSAGVVLAQFIEEQALTHAQLAERLGVDRTYVSKVPNAAT
jgi:predicted XRE-type DNA-binding protein